MLFLNIELKKNGEKQKIKARFYYNIFSWSIQLRIINNWFTHL